MTDTSTPGQKLDAAIAQANAAVSALRDALAEKVSEVGAVINAKIDEVQDAIDAIQDAVDARQANPRG